MADISKIEIQSGTYNIKDSTARASIQSINNDIDILEKTENYDNPFLDTSKKWAIVGDSIAKGTGSTGDNKGIDYYLKQMYPNLNIQNFGVNGATIGIINAEATIGTQVQTVLSSGFTDVIICAGVNDCLQTIATRNNHIGYPMDKIITEQFNSYPNNYDNQTSCSRLQSILNQFNLQQINCYICCSPTYSNTYYYYYDTLYYYMYFIAKKYGYGFIDLKRAFTTYSNPVLDNRVSGDKIHPSDKGYKYLTQVIHSKIKNKSFDIYPKSTFFISNTSVAQFCNGDTKTKDSTIEAILQDLAKSAVWISSEYYTVVSPKDDRTGAESASIGVLMTTARERIMCTVFTNSNDSYNMPIMFCTANGGTFNNSGTIPNLTNITKLYLKSTLMLDYKYSMLNNLNGLGQSAFSWGLPTDAPSAISSIFDSGELVVTDYVACVGDFKAFRITGFVTGTVAHVTYNTSSKSWQIIKYTLATNK